MKKSSVIIFFLFLFAISTYAVSPFITTTQSGGNLFVEYPKISYFIQNRDIKLHYHVYNSTGYLVTGNDTNPTACNLHLYDNTGAHIVEEYLTMDSNGMDFKYDFSDTERVGEYTAVVGCNNSKEAGFLSYEFEVTPTGTVFSEYITFAIIGGYFIIMFIFLFFIHQYKTDGASPLVYGVMGGTVSLFMVWFSLAFKPIPGQFSYYLTALFAGLALYFFAIGYAIYSDYKKEKDKLKPIY